MIKIKKNTVKGEVYSLLKKKWVDHLDIESTVSGDGMRRLRELRADGVNIAKRYNQKTGTYQYKVQ